MLLNNSVYIKFTWFFIVLSAVFGLLPYFFVGYRVVPILSNGATLYDVIYFNSMSIFFFTLSMIGSTAFLMLDSNFRIRSLSIVKYLAYSFSAILFVSMCFHFYYYDKSPDIELYVYIACVLCIAIRAWYTIGNLKHLLLTWAHRLKYH